MFLAFYGMCEEVLLHGKSVSRFINSDLVKVVGSKGLVAGSLTYQVRRELELKGFGQLRINGLVCGRDCSKSTTLFDKLTINLQCVKFVFM